MKFAALTDKGIVRDNNEDSYKIGENFLIVADGMGGHNAGEVASNIAVETASRVLSEAAEGYREKIEEAIITANNNVYALATGERKGMGTTMDVCVCSEGKVYIGHVGDSRVYVIRDKKAVKITEDHSYVEMLVAKGELTKEEAENYPMKNMITRAVGIGVSVECDLYELDIKPGDKIVLCTDGLTNMVSDAELEKVINTSKNIDEAVKTLVAKANKAGGTDNITLIIAENLFD